MTIKYYTPEEDRDPFSNVPWQTHQSFICTKDQYDSMVEITKDNKGLLWPSAYAYADRNNIVAGTLDLLSAIEEDKDVAGHVLNINEKIRTDLVYRDQLFKDLYFTGAPEEYIRTFYHGALFTNREFLLHCIKLSREMENSIGDARWPAIIETKNRNGRRSILFQDELLICDWWYNWESYELDKKPSKAYLIERAKTELNKDINLVTLKTWLTNNKELLT